MSDNQNRSELKWSTQNQGWDCPLPSLTRVLIVTHLCPTVRQKEAHLTMAFSGFLFPPKGDEEL